MPNPEANQHSSPLTTRERWSGGLTLLSMILFLVGLELLGNRSLTWNPNHAGLCWILGALVAVAGWIAWPRSRVAPWVIALNALVGGWLFLSSFVMH